MTPEQVKAEICRLVCTRFINLRTTTTRKSLVIKFAEIDGIPEALQELTSTGILRESTDHPAGPYYSPKLGAFVFAGDPDL